MKINRLTLRTSRNTKKQTAVVARKSALAGSIAMLAAAALSLGTASKASATNYWWDSGTDGDATVGGAGTWDLTNPFWDPTGLDAAANNIVWPNLTTDVAIFDGTGGAVVLGVPITAGGLKFASSGYILSGSTLTLGGAASLYAEYGETVTISSEIQGIVGLTKTGGGSIRLTNSSNSYTGTTTIANGSLVINSAAALGGIGTVSITLNNSTPLNTGSIGFGGGSLVLDGTAAGFTFSRDINFEGRGPLGDRSSAILSLGNNTLSGILTSAVSPLPLSPTATIRNSRINSVNGLLTISGNLSVGGTVGTTITSLGGVNTAGVNNFSFAGGTITGTGTFEKSGAGVLDLNGNASGFTGAVRTAALSIGQQSSVRVTQTTVSGTSVFGAGTTSGATAQIDLNGGVLEFLSNSNLDFNALTSGKNVFLRGSTVVYTGPAGGGDVVNGLTTLGLFRVGQGATGTFRSRNGFGVTLGAWSQESSNGNSAITNEMGGTLNFTGDAWNNADGSARNLTFAGNGNIRIAGNITATGTTKQVIKQGTGELILNGTAGTFTGLTNIQAGTVRINDFRSINNGTTVGVSLGNGTTTAGNLIIGGTGVGTATAAGLTTSKVINFNTTTGQSSIYANQAIASPVILNAVTTALTTGNYNFGGSNTSDNIINVPLPIGTTAGFTKTGAGTWVLNAANGFTGNTNIQNGTLKLRATAAASDVINNAGAVVFSVQATAQTAGGILEFRGFTAAATTETLGALTPTAGAATVRLLGNGAAANLTFTTLGATTAASSVNFDTSSATGGVVTLTGVGSATATTLPGTANFQGHLYIDGANFADSVAGVVTAPTYAAAGNFQNAGAALVAGVHNRLTVPAASGAATISSLLTNNQTLTLSGNLNISTGGILQSGGTASILSDSATPRLIQGGVAATNVAIRVNLLADVLNLGNATNPVNIASATTGGLTKNGAGTLVVFGTNAQTGTTTINEGKVSLNGANARLSATTASLVIRQGATLELNGSLSANSIVNALDGAGTIVNANASGVTFTQNGGGTWNGIFSSGTGVLNITKAGGAATWSNVNTYTGVTTIGGTGLVTVDTLAIGGSGSGIGASPAAATNLIFNGSTAGIDYRGSIIDTALTLGSRSATTDRLFTLAAAATGANLSSTASNNNAIVWSSTGAIVNNTTANALLTFTGTSTGDNTFNPQLGDSSVGGGVTLSVTKSGAGQWNLGSTSNAYTGLTTIAEGILGLNNSGALSGSSPLVLGNSTTSGILQASGSFARTLTATPTAGTGTITWGGTTGGGGFAAHATSLSVTLDGGAGLTWGSGGFVPTGASLILNSTSSLANVTFTNAIDLGATIRTVTVNDNAQTGADYADLTGVLSGTGGSLFKNGAGILRLGNLNSYTGLTAVDAGTLVVSSLGSSAVVGTSSVGAGGVAMGDTNAIVLGNTTTTGGNLVYVGAGETSDRKIRLRGTTANSAIYADGAGPVILTNVAHDTVETGAKTLSLRGTNTGNNMITSVLTDNGGALTVSVDGGATWILTNSSNSYTGGTSAGAGALGIGHDSALAGGALTNTNGNVFAYGADRTIANALAIPNNVSSGWLGDYSLTVSGITTLAAAANNITFNNSIVAGKALILNGGVTANALTANRAWIIDGPGETAVNGNFTTSTAFGVRFDVNGGGTLTLGTNGATSNFNQSITAVDVDRGKLKFTANNAIPTAAAGSGGVTLTPELVTADTATLDLNGTNQTLNAFTATSDGTSIITNSAVGPATLTVGANNNAATFGAVGLGIYSITQPAGVINLGKVGTGTANFSGTLGNTGSTTVSGGVMNYNSPTGTTSLTIASGGTLNVKAGLTTPANLTSVVLAGGGSLSFADNAGTPFANLTALSLGLGSGIATLELEAGDLGTDTITLLAPNVATTANTINLLVKDFDISNGSTYNLLVAPSGGLTTTGIYTFSLAGYSGSTLFQSDTLVAITAGTLLTTDVYWAGATVPATTVWNTIDGTLNTNFSTDLAGTIQSTTLPGKGQKVIFQAENITGGAALSTTLNQPFKINALEFRQSTVTTDTSASVSIGSGVGVNSLTLAPSATTDGIRMLTGGTPTVNISAPVVALNNQTWTTTDATQNLNLSAALSGAGNVTKTGAGTVTLSAAGPSFTGTFTVNGGTAVITTATALGGVVATPGSGSDVTIGSTAAFYYNGAAGTVPNDIALNGGTLSAGTGNQIYSGAINVSADSVINMRNNNSAVLTDAARNITLPGIVSGGNSITLDSINTVTTGNQFTGTLTLTNTNNSWTGGLSFNRGTAVLGATVSPNFTANNVTFNTFGRLQLAGANGTTLTRTGTLNYGAGAIGEFSVDNAAATPTTDYTVNQTTLTTLGAGGTGGHARIFLVDAFSKMTISGGVLLEGNSDISVGGDIAGVVTISSVINDGANTYSLGINNDFGGWATTNRTVHLTMANTYDGGTDLASGTLILGDKNALGTGPLTVSAASTLMASTDLSVANAVGNATTLNANLVVTGVNNLDLSGAFIGTGGDANRTLTNNLTGSTLRLTGTPTIGAPANTAARTLTIDGTGNTTITTPIANGVFAGNALTKGGTGTLTLDGLDPVAANNYGGLTTINAGAVVVNNTSPSLTGGLTLGAAATLAPVSLDLNAVSATFGGALTMNINSTTASTITVDGGQTLTFNGGLVLTNTTDGATNALTINGGGALVVTGAAFTVGSTAGASNSSKAILDLSALSSVTATLSGNLSVQLVGDNNGADASSLILSNTANTLTAVAVGVGVSATGPAQTMTLGAGTNVIRTNTLNLGTGTRDSGVVSFGGNVTGDVDIKDVAGTGPVAFNMGTGGATTAFGAANIFDVSGHNATLQLGVVNIGTQTARVGAMTNVFSFNQGTLSMTSLNMSSRNTAAGTTSTFNISGGTVTSGAITMATTGAAAGVAVANLNITGSGNVTMSGNITKVGGAGTDTANFTLNGATAVLDMGGFTLGGAGANALDSTILAQGTLQNLGEFNGGATLTKTTAGTLKLLGANSYTGETVITEGTVEINNVAAGAVPQSLGTNTGVNAVTLGAAGTTVATLNYTGAAGTLSKNINAIGGIGGIGNPSNIIRNSGAGLLTLTGTLAKSGTNLTLDGGANGIFLGVGGTITGAAANSDLIVTGAVDLGAGTHSYVGPTTVQAGASLTVSGTLSGTTGVTVNSGGTLLLNNTTSAPITTTPPVNLGSAPGVNATIQMGTTVTGIAQNFGAMTLNNNSTLDFGTAAGAGNSFVFTTGSYVGGTLTIANWTGTFLTLGTTGTDDRLIFTGDETARTNFLAAFSQPSISFTGFSSGYDAIGFGGGTQFEIVPVPEPATTALIGAVALCALIGYRERRRFTVRGRLASK